MLSVFVVDFRSDGITLIVAAVCVLISFGQQWHCRKKITTTDSVMSLLNGASVFPFCLMVGATFSPDFLQAATASKASMSMAGLVGLLFVGGEVLSPAGLKKQSPKTIVAQPAS